MYPNDKPHISVREKFKEVVFVYVSDDLKWGKQKIRKRARNRNVDIYFVGANTSTNRKALDRNRCLNAKYVYIQIIFRYFKCIVDINYRHKF